MTSAPFGSASILPISWMYINMMGTKGLKKASQVAILSANYMKAKLDKYFRVNFVSRNGSFVAHEFILDISDFNKHGVHAEDVAKRLMDFGFHGPTMSWPVPETLMIEPTESEPKKELDRFIAAMVHIRGEIDQVVRGEIPMKSSPLARAPHTMQDIIDNNWDRPYTREQAAFPLPWVKQHKHWPTVNRLDNIWGDRNIHCSCDGWDAVASANKTQEKN